MEFTARHFETGELLRLEILDGLISNVSSAEAAGRAPDELPWVAPAFWDLQFNGRWGYSFSDAGLTVDQVVEVVQAQRALGAARLCPTLITAPPAQLRHGVATIAAACEQDAVVSAMVVGIHLEGPFLSGRDGYRGAHPVEAIRDPDWGLFEQLQEDAGGRIRLMTLAPEKPGAIEFIRRVTASGVTIALGHTAADPETIGRAVDAGARLSTHLGNGIEAVLPRHPNPIWTQAADDRLMASLIADGHHLDRCTLRVLARAKGPGRIILVSDASPLAGLPVGTYGPWAVDPSGKIVVAATPYLAGSNQALETGLSNLRAATGWTLADTMASVTANPSRLLGMPRPELRAGEPANLVLLRVSDDDLRLSETCVDGAWQRPVS